MTQIKSQVSLARSPDHYHGVTACLEPLKEDLERRLSALPFVVIKINMVISKTPAYSQGVELAATPVDAVRSFVDFIRPFYKEKIIIAEEPAWGDTTEGFQIYGFTELCKQYDGVELRDLKRDETITKKITFPIGELELPFSKTLLEAPLIVSIVRPKTHTSVGMTASVKNVLVGAIHKHSMRRKIHRGRHIHWIHAEISDLVFPHFSIIDGTIGMEGGGPVRGEPKKAGFAASSFDGLALDSLAAYLMGFAPPEIGYLWLLKERQKGLLYPDKDIEILGENPADLVNPFKKHPNFNKIREWRG